MLRKPLFVTQWGNFALQQLCKRGEIQPNNVLQMPIA